MSEEESSAECEFPKEIVRIPRPHRGQVKRKGILRISLIFVIAKRIP